MGDDEAGAVRDRHFVVIALGRLVGNGEQDQRRWAGVPPVPLDGSELGRLILGHLKAVLIADDKLERRQHRRHGDAHLEHGARVFLIAPGDDEARADRHDDERRGEIGGGHHVNEAHRERRIEDDRQPIRGIGDTVAHEMTRRKLHPRIRRDDPERRGHRANGDEDGGEHVQPRRNAVPAEEHDAEERRLEEEGGQHLVADERTDDIAHDH